MQSNATINICIVKRCFYIASLNNYIFRPLYRPSSGCKFSYFKAYYKIYNVFVFVNQISYTSIKSAFKMTTVSVELKSYPEIKYINSIKSWVCDLRREGVYGVKLGIFLFGNTYFLLCQRIGCPVVP